jgi:hypothetical protein
MVGGSLKKRGGRLERSALPHVGLPESWLNISGLVTVTLVLFPLLLLVLLDTGTPLRPLLSTLLCIDEGRLKGTLVPLTEATRPLIESSEGWSLLKYDTSKVEEPGLANPMTE